MEYFRGFAKPQFKIATDENVTRDEYSQTYVASPLERGFATTLGNALRRVMLSSLPGAAIYAVEIEGANNECACLEGVVEDVAAIVLNIKEIVLRIDQTVVRDDPVLTLEATAQNDVEAEATANDIVCPAGVEIVNKDLHLATVARGTLKMTLHATMGRGFVSSDENWTKYGRDLPYGAICVDSKFSPAANVNFRVEETVGHENLKLFVKTNGGITPADAVALAAKILSAHFEAFTSVSADKAADTPVMIEDEKPQEVQYDNMQLDELVLSVRSYNSLKRKGISTVGELIGMTEAEVAKIRNLGKKSLQEIKNVLAASGLRFKEPE